MARNISKMSRSPKPKTMNVAFWGKNNTTTSDFKAGGEAIKRKKEGGHTNKSTNDFIEDLKKRGEW
tara:strand:+ start:138 stop:335 length:198 start_codon:yes stop_codon:yes gene_type:complete